MKVKEVVVGKPVSCRPETNLGAAVEMLWNHNCGILPIVRDDGKVIGVVTDRDICIALGTRDRLAGEICVGEVTTGKVFSCAPDDDIHSALETMRRQKVRRLPVVGNDGTLQAVLSMDDVVLHSGTHGRTAELSFDGVVSTLKTIYAHQVSERGPAKSAAA